MSDDLTGKYMNSKKPFDPAEALLAQQEPEESTILGSMAAMTVNGLNQVKSVVSDVAGGIVETPRQIVGGIGDAVQQVVYAADDLTEGLGESLSDAGIPDVIQFTDAEGNIDFDLLTREEARETGRKVGEIPKVDEARTATGGLVRGVSQFLTGFIPAVKGVKAVGVTGGVSSSFAGGALADAVVFDPLEDRVADLIESVPVLSNPITQYLEAKPDDSKAEGRFKNAIEGLALGGITETFMKAMRLMRSSRIAKAKAAEIEQGRAAAEKIDDFVSFDDKLKESSPEFDIETKPTKAPLEAAQNINTANLKTTDEVDNLINKVAEADAVKINEARREVITHEATEELADQMGMSVKDLLKRRQGQAFNAEQALAARKILVASAENLTKLAKNAKAGSEEDVLLFRKALSQHTAIQQQVSGLTAEAGRALSSFNIVAESSEGQARAIKEMLEAGGGLEHSKDIAQKLSELEPHQMGVFIREADKAKTSDMIYEAWINALLSNPATHTVNVLSNSIVAAWSVGERKIASWIGKGLGAQSIPEGEATAQLKGMVEGAKDGMKLAWHTIKTGDPSDPLQKVEHQAFKSITAENLNLTGTSGRFADFMGEAIRTPGRMLTAGDELFKSIGYRMELNSQAYRTAYNEGLRGEDLAERMVSIIKNPPENLHLAAVDAGRYQTFTKELGEAGKAVQTARSKIPGARVIMPFVRTPVNIMKYVGERTPLAPLAPSVREEIIAGGARRDMALAKIATGSTMMAIAADFSLSGDITGAGPTNPQMRNTLRATGWQPYSIKVGDEYISYSRLDPIGAFIGLAADITEISGQSSEADVLDMTTASTLSVAQNVSSKTYLQGVSEFFTVMSSASVDPEANNARMKKWITRLAGTVVPSGVAQLERTVDPTLRSTYGILDQIKSRIPGYSDDLPPRRNIFGEPIVLSGGIGLDIMSPIYTSSDKKDPVADEIVKQKTMLRMPLKNIQGQDLDAHQYDRYIQLYSGKDNKHMNNKPIKTTLKELFRSSAYLNATDGQDGGKSLMIETIFSGYRDAAKQQMLEEFPEIKNDIILDKQRKMLELLGE